MTRSKSKRPATAGAVRVVDVPKKTSIPEVRNESMERHAAAALAREAAANKPLPEPIYYTPGEAHESRVPAGLDPSKNGPGSREPPARAPPDVPAPAPARAASGREVDRGLLARGDVIARGEKGDAAYEIKELGKFGQIFRSGITCTHFILPQLNSLTCAFHHP